MGFFEDLSSAAGFDEPITEGPSWKDRISDGAYTSPSGLRITFDYEDLTSKWVKKGTAFEFPDFNGTLVQEKGSTNRRHPTRVYFSGPDCDKQAAVFEAAIAERGRGIFERPFYAPSDVVILGDIERQDRLVSGANEVIFTLTFFDTVGVAFPQVQEDEVSAIDVALELFGDASSAEFASALNLGSVSEETDFIDNMNDMIENVDEVMSEIAAVQQVVADEFENLVDAVKFGLETLIGDPLSLANQTIRLVTAPSRALASISDRLEAYGNLAQRTFNQGDSVSDPGGPGGKGPRIEAETGVGNDSQAPNKYHTRDLFLKSYVSGSVTSTIYTANRSGTAASNVGVKRIQKNAVDTNVVARGNQFQTADQAIEAAEALLVQFDAVSDWRDDNFESLSGWADDPTGFINTPSNTDTGGSHQHLQTAVYLAVGYLIRISFTLARTRWVTLQRPRNIVELASQLYGNVDDSTLDFIIDSNDLSGSEILEIPRGRRILYYE